MPTKVIDKVVYQVTTYFVDSQGSDPATTTCQGKSARAHWAGIRSEPEFLLAQRLAAREIDERVRRFRRRERRKDGGVSANHR